MAEPNGQLTAIHKTLGEVQGAVGEVKGELSGLAKHIQALPCIRDDRRINSLESWRDRLIGGWAVIALGMTILGVAILYWK